MSPRAATRSRDDRVWSPDLMSGDPDEVQDLPDVDQRGVSRQ
jgi:hypothetical protein